MENIILQLLNIYFWVFIVAYVIKFLYTFTDEYKITKENAILNGNYHYGFIQTVICWSLFILSIILT